MTNPLGTSMTRRGFLACAGTLATGALLAGCAGTPSSPASETAADDAPSGASTSDEDRVPVSSSEASGATTLVVFFSRPGENYGSPDFVNVEVGNTEVMAGYVADAISCDVFKVEPAEPYPSGYFDTCGRARQELDEDARPAVANLADAPDLAAYDTVLVGAPVWWGSEPRVMLTYLESQDLSGKIVIPFTTHAGSGLGTAVADCQAACKGATVDEGRASSREGQGIESAGDEVRTWARGLGLATR
jgi:flavodoxin